MGFDSFLGNKAAVSILRGMLASGQVPGTMLFSGPDGVGKRTLAIMLAKAINCMKRGPAGDDFCGECAHCKSVDEMLKSGIDDLARRRDTSDAQKRTENLVYFDVQIVAPITRFILSEQIRQLCATAYSRPFELPQRVLIIDEAQDIHWQATDLLLKLLEEPPATATLILICPNPYQLRTTIRSRCVRVDFAPVEDAILEPLLAQDARIEAAQRTLALRLTGGSIAKARAPDFAEYEAQRRPWLDFIGALAGSLSSPRAAQWDRLIAATKAISANRDQWEATLRVGYMLCRDLMVCLSEPEGRFLVNVDQKSHLESWARQLGFDRLARLMAGLDESYRLRSRNVNAQISLDALAAGILERQRSDVQRSF
jgi:DNA polymerase III subunit delta'